MERFILDERSGVYLLFPDQAVLGIVSEEKEDDRLFASISIALSAWIENPDVPKPNRQVVLTDEYFDVIRPTDPRINRFRFVRKEGLTGSITLVCDPFDWQDIRRRIGEEPEYLRIEYKGTTEEYWAYRKLASMSLSIGELKSLRTMRTIYGQLSVLKRWMSEKTTMSTADIDLWLQVAVDTQFPVRFIDNSFLLQIPDESVTIEYKRLMQSVSSISANPSNTRIVWG